MNIFKHRPLAFLCAVYIVSFFISCYISPAAKVVLIIINLLTAVVLILMRKNICAVCICMILALVYGYFYFDIHVANALSLAEKDEDTVRFEIVDITFMNEDIAFLDGRLISDDENDGDICHFTLNSPCEISEGDVIDAEVKFYDILPVDGFDAERYYHSQNIWIAATTSSYSVSGHNTDLLKSFINGIRDYCSNSFEKYTEEDTASLLGALSIGDKSGIDDSVRRDFRRVGLSHMLAISGMHLAVIMGCLTAFCNVLHLNKRLGVAIVSVICFTYIFISGAAPSVVRAGIMFLLMSFASLLRRKGDSLTNLFVAAFLIITFSPSGVFDVGMILSFTSTLGIIVIVGYYMKRRNYQEEATLLKKVATLIGIPVLTSLSAMAFSFLPLLIFFDEISMISVISNLCLAPFVTALLFILPCFICLTFLPILPAVVGVFLDIDADIIYALVKALSSIPNVSINLNYPFLPYTLIGIAAGAVILSAVRKRICYLMPYLCWFMIFTICIASYNISFKRASDVVFYSDSGSDAMLIRSSASSVYLDLSNDSNAALKRSFGCTDSLLYTKEIDTWIITCYSNNAVRNMSDYLNTYYIHNILIPTPDSDYSEVCAEEIEYYAAEEDVSVSYYAYGEEFICNGNAYTVYAPITFEDSNVMIPSADVICNSERISYYGCGYFDYGDFRGDCDYLYIGEKGSRRKQKNSPAVNAEYAVIAEYNEIAALNITSDIKFGLSDDDKFVKIRIG